MNIVAKIGVLISSEIPQLNEIVDLRRLYFELNQHIAILASHINLHDLGEWKLLVSINYRNTDKIGIFKRLKRFSSDKEYEISISIPIPDKRKAIYGIAQVDTSFYSQITESLFYSLEPAYDKYLDLSTYMKDSAKSSILFILKQGFKCNGIKIQFKA